MSGGPALRVSRVHFPVTALGPGPRLGIWVQGCELACPGCMSRDTWDPSGGTTMTVADVLAVWRDAYARGARGVTISGGEPTRQLDALAALIDGIRATSPQAGASAQVDVLLFSGLDRSEFIDLVPQLASRVDAAVVGRFDVTRPTDLVWRGSANQELIPLTALGMQRFGQHVSRTTTAPPVQFAVDDEGIWLVGIPRIGDLPALERRMRANGIVLGDPSWRP